MAIKKKAILTDDTTLPTLNPLPPPAYTNIISIPFALGIGISPAPNRRNIPITPDSIFPLRPSQNIGFDKSITLLTQPNPMYLNDINGIFYLYSGALSDICGGIVPKFETGYIAGQNDAGIDITKQGYRQGAILFNAATSAWVQSLADYNKQSPTDAPTTWQQITLPNLPVIGNSTAGIQVNVPATTINFVGATVQANATNANNAIVTIISPIQRIIFTNPNAAPPSQYLVPPAGATGVILTATAFGGSGGSSIANYYGGGGGAGGGFNNFNFILPLDSYEVSYVPTTGSNPSGQLTIRTKNNLIFILNNGQNGVDATSAGGGAGGTGGAAVLRNSAGGGSIYIINPPPYATGTNGGSSDISNVGAGGASILSNGQEIRANGNTVIYGSGGGSGGPQSGSLGGYAIVIAEWVFP